jgi:hypothetical protein
MGSSSRTPIHTHTHRGRETQTQTQTHTKTHTHTQTHWSNFVCYKIIHTSYNINVTSILKQEKKKKRCASMRMADFWLTSILIHPGSFPRKKFWKVREPLVHMTYKAAMNIQCHCLFLQEFFFPNHICHIKPLWLWSNFQNFRIRTVQVVVEPSQWEVLSLKPKAKA